MAETQKKSVLRVLVKPSELPDRWLAVCVDRYMVAEGDSPKDAVKALDRVVRVEVAHGVEKGYENPLKRLSKAPAKYLDAFESASMSPAPKRRTTPKRFATEFEQRLIAASA